MSTEISITVQLEGILEIVKRIQEAARKRQLERERQERIEKEAREKLADDTALDKTFANEPDPIKSKARIRPAANRTASSIVGHMWIGSIGTYGLTETFGLLVNALGTSGSSIYSGTSINSYDFYSGKGLSSIPGYTHTSVKPPYPTDGYEWEPTLGSATNFDNTFGNDIYVYAYGPRTARVITRSVGPGAYADPVILPIGRDKFIALMVTGDSSGEFTVDATMDHEEVENVTLLPLDQRDPATVLAEFLLPGAQVSNGPIGLLVQPEGTSDPADMVYATPPATPYIYTENLSPVAPLKASAYYCSNTVVKKIQPSGMLNDILDLITPSIVYNEVTYGSQTFTYPTYQPKPGANTLTQVTEQVRSPDIYSRINNVLPYTDPTNIMTRTSADETLFRDQSEGSAFAIVDGQAVPVWDSDLPLRYEARRYVPGGVKKRLLSFSPSPDRDRDLEFMNLIAVWDWDEPAYCRKRLNDLGISEADLLSWAAEP